MDAAARFIEDDTDAGRAEEVRHPRGMLMAAETNPERLRLEEAKARTQAWRKWGPYVSERQWGTVREDYSADGDAWGYFPHEHAASRAYRWGEDGIAGLCDDKQRLCLSLALWNGKDPILKERMFGLSNRQGNHGEDVKELYYYLDATPTYSYARMLYKYPQAEFPYAHLVEENARRTRQQPEFEIIDTGIFDADRYFDVDIEYAKVGDRRHPAADHGEQSRPAIRPRSTCCRRSGFATPGAGSTDGKKPSLEQRRPERSSGPARHARRAYRRTSNSADQIVFCDNETNLPKLYGVESPHGYFKDGFHEYRGARQQGRGQPGTRRAPRRRASYAPTVAAGRQRGHPAPAQRRPAQPGRLSPISTASSRCAIARRMPFTATCRSNMTDEDVRRVQRQAFAGMLWSKQYLPLRRDRMADGRCRRADAAGEPAVRPQQRMGPCQYATDVISMPDKWEYPWFAAWDWAFHLRTLALI